MSSIPTGVGLGLRSQFIGAIARGDADGQLAFVEVAPENYLDRGGRGLALFEQVAERHPTITHGLMLSLGGTDPLRHDFLAALKPFVQRHSPWHSDHLCFSSDRGGILHDLLPLPRTGETVRRIAGRIHEAQDALEHPMAIENISYYLEMGVPELDEPDFIRAVVEEADCGLLLDVNNILVNAKNFGFEAMDWLERMPLDRVVQMHVAGHEAWNDLEMYVDTHGETAEPAVHEMMQWVVERVGPLPVLLERDKNIPPLPDLLREVADLQSSYDAALARWETQPAASSKARA